MSITSTVIAYTYISDFQKNCLSSHCRIREVFLEALTKNV